MAPNLVAIVILAALILATAILAGALSLRRSRGSERGSRPGKGYHVIDINYDSGGGGGAQQASYRVPRDPQAYAKSFVPRGKRK